MIHLHLHSHYSVLDGLGRPDQIVAKAKALGATAVGITDHASISALPDFMKAAKDAGIKPIVGCEFYVVDDAEPEKGEKRYHITTWAKNWAGVQALMRALTLANNQFYFRPRLTWQQALELGPDVIVGTACAMGVLAHDNWQALATQFSHAYGADFYLEIMPHDITEGGNDLQRIVNERAIVLAQETGIKLLATNDAHYVEQADSQNHEVMLAIQGNKAWSDPNRWKFGGDGFYMRNTVEMIDTFSALPYLDAALPEGFSTVADAILKAPQEIADKVDIQMPAFEVHLPSIYADEGKVFMAKIMAGWDRLPRALRDNRTYFDRLMYEVSVITKLGFVRYFLIVEDIIDWARSQGIMVGPGRGSAAGSLVCYLMGITLVDPMRHNLIFERFLNPERVDLPDIDVDFADDRRGEVFDYITRKYGEAMTAKINTFNALTVKSAFRDVARTFGVHMLTVNMLSKQIEDADSFKNVPEAAKFAAEQPEIVKTALALDGTIRGCGVHAAGIVVSSQPLTDVCAIERRKDTAVVNWDKVEAERFGLLKIDVLGLSTLTVLNRAKAFIKATKGVEVDYNRIPLDDPATGAMFAKGQGTGVFQFENDGMQELLVKLGANTFEAITDTTALYRPGPLQSGQTDKYVAVARGDEYARYAHPLLEPILSPTKGVFVYQEQVMAIFRDMGGFTWPEADKMRKIIAKKLGKEELEKHRGHFVQGAKAKGVDEAIASGLFDQIRECADYLFNAAHAVSYSIISWWSMYLKAHFPVEFFAAQMSVCDEDKMRIVANEARRYGVTLRRPDVNSSGETFTINSAGQIVAPLSIIKGVGEKAVAAILGERHANGQYSNLEEFVSRVPRRLVNIRVVDALSRGGAMETIGVQERDPEVRAKNLAELLPTYNTMPNLSRRNDDFNETAVAEVLRRALVCAHNAGKKCLMPKFSGAKAKPPIMVINNAVKNEQEHLTSDGTKVMAKHMKAAGLTMRDVYYTSPVKCVGCGDNKMCVANCLALLRDEIRAVRPKLIVMCVNTMLDMFVKDKPSMKKLHGTVQYNKEFDCYVLFSYSPQYDHFSDLGMWAKTSETLQELFCA